MNAIEETILDFIFSNLTLLEVMMETNSIDDVTLSVTDLLQQNQELNGITFDQVQNLIMENV